MVDVKKYHLPPTPLIPNSPYPLLHYPGFLSSANTTTTATTTDLKSSESPPSSPQISASHVHDLFAHNGWTTQWIVRYGPTQASHYHSRTHECMAVLSGVGLIRFGVADTSPDLEASTSGTAYEPGGVVVEARAGDVFVIPAGVAHKTHRVAPEAEFKLLTPGDGHGVDASDCGGDVRGVLEGLELDGFTMIGAYPEGGRWDFAVGGEVEGKEGFQRVWDVERPGRDPVLGVAEEGLCGLWKEE